MTANQNPRRDTGGQDDARGNGTSTSVTGATARRPQCPWLLAAARTGDQFVVAAVIRLHPPARCPAARRERAR
jgi:hypothetical protein